MGTAHPTKIFIYSTERFDAIDILGGNNGFGVFDERLYQS
jgi:hypothetical protein